MATAGLPAGACPDAASSVSMYAARCANEALSSDSKNARSSASFAAARRWVRSRKKYAESGPGAHWPKATGPSASAASEIHAPHRMARMIDPKKRRRRSAATRPGGGGSTSPGARAPCRTPPRLVAAACSESARLVIGEGLLELLAGVHDERPVPRHRLAQRSPGDEDRAAHGRAPRYAGIATVTEHREGLGVDGRRFARPADAHRTFVHV